MADERALAGPRARGRGRHVVLADVAAVGAGPRREVGAVVDDEQRAGVVAQPPGDGGAGQQLVGARRLVAQLHDVDAAGERRGEHVGECAPAGRQVADEVQAGRLQARAALVEAKHHGHCGDPPPSTLHRIREPARAG